MTDQEREALVGDGLLTVREACQFLRVSRSWLYAAMEKGLVSYVRFAQDGRRAARRVPRAGLVAFAAQHLVNVKREDTSAEVTIQRRVGARDVKG